MTIGTVSSKGLTQERKLKNYLKTEESRAQKIDSQIKSLYYVMSKFRTHDNEVNRSVLMYIL